MAAILTSLRNTVLAGFALAVVVWLIYSAIQAFSFDKAFWQFLFRYLHVLSGVMWIGLLWYLNFVQIPTMPQIPDELKPAIGKHDHAECAVLVPLGRHGDHRHRS